MFIGATGLVVDQFGQVLLIQRDDSRTWAMPGGALEAGELPTEGVIREVREETGIDVVPARLVSLDFWHNNRKDYLIFTFRCVAEGGKIQPSEESPKVGYFPIDPPPRPMLSMHRERLMRGYRHSDGPPQWGRQYPPRWFSILWRTVGPLVYRWKDIRRSRLGKPRYQPPPSWHTGAFAIIRNESGDVLWVKRRDYDVWNLPGGKSENGEAPWETAVRETREETGLDISLDNLSGVYLKKAENDVIFNFTAKVISGRLTTGSESVEFAYFPPGEEPENSLPKQLERVQDVILSSETTLFKSQDGPSGLETLRLT